ncbi:MAG: hypothetical protein JO142_22075, partial [Burkholderiales bacterium]|nr:hypothetical protein [Burkholderiales bacterium]
HEHYERLGMGLNICGRLVSGQSEMAVLQAAASQMLDMRRRHERTQAWTIDDTGKQVLIEALELCDCIWERSSPQQLYHVYCQLTHKLRRATAEAAAS